MGWTMDNYVEKWYHNKEIKIYRSDTARYNMLRISISPNGITNSTTAHIAIFIYIRSKWTWFLLFCHSNGRSHAAKETFFMNFVFFFSLEVCFHVILERLNDIMTTLQVERSVNNLIVFINKTFVWYYFLEWTRQRPTNQVACSEITATL